MTRRLPSILVSALATALLAASPAAAVGPAYKLATGGAGVLVATPAAGGSTLAVQIRRSGAGVEFAPAAAAAPAGCASAAGVTTCPGTLVSSELRLQAPIVQAGVAGVSTSKLTFEGGGENDALVVDGPEAPAAPIGEVALQPGGGDDSITVQGRVNAITLAGADAGNDRYVITSTSTSITGTLQLGPGNDFASSYAPNLTLDGGTGDDTLIGNGELVGGAGSDVLKPRVVGKGAEGGAGDIDRLSFDQMTSGLTLTKDGGTVTGDGSTKTGFEELEGTKGNDTLIGTGTSDDLAGDQGDDTLEGKGGSDRLDGGPGADAVSYAFESDAINVNLLGGTAVWAKGTDVLLSFTGVLTGSGNDVVTGTPASEIFGLGAGHDYVDAGYGNDSVVAGAGNDLVRGGHGTDTLDGGEGADTATYDERGGGEAVAVDLNAATGNGVAGENDTLTGFENAKGGASNDLLVGNDAPNVLLGGPGLNVIHGLGGNDILHGGDNRDVITGGAGFDQLMGFGDDDSINAFDGGPDIVDCGSALDDDAQVDAADQVANCEYSRRGDVPVPVDADGDGFVAGFDCDDTNPALNPGAKDIVGDGIDQDCDGFDQPVPYVEYGLSARFSGATRGGRRIQRLTLTKLADDVTVRVTCRTTSRYPRRCPFTRRTRKPSSRGNVALRSLFRNRRLPPATRIELRISAPGINGRVRRFTIRTTGSVRDQRLCLPLGRKSPRTCPAGDE